MKYLEFLKHERAYVDNASRNEIGDFFMWMSSSLPETIDSLFYNTGLYLTGKAELEAFVKYFCETIEPLYWRIAIGKDKELFKESYAPEIKMISEIRNAMSNKEETDKLDDAIEALSREYLKQPIKRKHYFAV